LLTGSILNIIGNGKSTCDNSLIKSENNNIHHYSSSKTHTIKKQRSGNDGLCSDNDDHDNEGNKRHHSNPIHHQLGLKQQQKRIKKERSRSKSKSRSRSRSRSNSRNCKSAESQSSGGSLSNHSLAVMGSGLFPTE
jgi:hypothetical protein